MTDYISREALCYQLEKQETIDGQPRAIRRARRIVEDFSAADVRSVVHGRWKRGAYTDVAPNDIEFYYCSECGHRLQTYRTRYCPNCGARMEG